MALVRPALRVEEHVIENDGKRAMTVRLEPWGDEVRLRAGDELRVMARGPAGGSLEMVRRGTKLVVYAWPGASIRTDRDGAQARSTAPHLPDGMAMREWLEAVAT